MADIHPHVPPTPHSPAPTPAATGVDQPRREEEAPPRKKKRWGRRLLLTGLVLVLLLAVLVALAPMLLSTGPGTNFLLGLVNDRIRGHLMVDDLNLGWSGQSAHGVKLYGADRALIADVRSLDAPGVGLIGLARGSGDYDTVRIDVTKVAAARDEAGDLNVAQALSSPDPTPAKQEANAGGGLPEDFSLKLTLNVDQLTYTEPGEEAVTLKDFKLGLDAPNPQDISLHDVQGTVRRGEGAAAGEAGEIAIQSVRLQNAFAADGSLATGSMQVGGKGALKQIPTALLGFATEQLPLLQALIGPSFSTTFDGGGGVKDASGSVTFASQYITLDARVQAAGDTVSVVNGEGPELDITLQPEAFELLTVSEGVDGKPAEPGAYALAEPVRFVADVERLTMARTADGVNWQHAAITLRGKADALTLVKTASPDPATPAQGQEGGEGGEGGGEAQRIAMRDATLLVEAGDLGQRVHVTITGTADVDGTVKPVSLQVAAVNLFPVESAGQDVARTSYDVSSTDFPVPLIDAAGGLDGLATAGLGETVSVDATLVAATPEEAKQGVKYHAKVTTLKSPRLTLDKEAKVKLMADASGAFAGVHLRDPMSANFVMADGLAAQLQGEEPTFTVVRGQPLRGRVQVDGLTWMLPAADADPNATVRAAESSVDMTLTVQSGAIRLEQPVGERKAGTVIDIQGLTVQAKSEKNLAEGLNWLLNLKFLEQSEGDVPPPAGAVGRPAGREGGQAGVISGKGTLTELFDKAGVMQAGSAGVTADLTLENVPGSLVTAVTGQPTVGAMVGQSVRGTANLDYQTGRAGSIDIALDGDNTTIRLAGPVDKEGVFRPSSDQTQRVNVTQEVGDTLLTSFVPYLAGVVNATAPLELTLAKGSAIPLRNFDLKNVDATLGFDLRGAKLGPDAQIASLLKLLGVKIDDLDVSAIAPSLQVKGGQLVYGQPVTLQLGDETLSFSDGKFDLSSGAIQSLSMTLVSTSVKELNGFTLPVTGTLSAPQLNQDKLVQALAEQGIRQGIGELLGGDKEKKGADDGGRDGGVGGILGDVLGGGRDRDKDADKRDDDVPEGAISRPRRDRQRDRNDDTAPPPGAISRPRE